MIFQLAFFYLKRIGNSFKIIFVFTFLKLLVNCDAILLLDFLLKFLLYLEKFLRVESIEFTLAFLVCEIWHFVLITVNCVFNFLDSLWNTKVRAITANLRLFGFFVFKLAHRLDPTVTMVHFWCGGEPLNAKQLAAVVVDVLKALGLFNFGVSFELEHS